MKKQTNPLKTMSPIASHADHVGSLLRPTNLIAARQGYKQGSLTSGGLKDVEDRCIVNAVREQKRLGLATVSDGEMRRLYWHYDFLGGLGGVVFEEVDRTKPSMAGFTHAHRLQVTGPIVWRNDHPFLEHFGFLQSQAQGAVAKLTIPSPSVLHFRFGHQATASGIYENPDAMFPDIARAYAQAVTAFGRAGCRFLQFDEVNLAMLCDATQIAQAKERGVYRDDLAVRYASVINEAIAARPSEMKIGMHLCRGNFKSTWIANGGYEPVADALFNRIDVDVYYMEYDSDRAGGFEPLRYLPKGDKRVVLGLVTSKTGALEARDELIRRVEEAARYAPLEQLAISPQCGFASTEEGNTLSEAQQWEKLELCARVAEQIWK